MSFNQFNISDFFKRSLLFSHDFQFFFFQNFHLCLFKSFKNQNIKHWFNFFIKIKGWILSFNLSVSILSQLLRFKERCWRPVDIEITLNANLKLWRFISYVFNKLVCLRLTIKSSFKWFWSSTIHLFKVFLFPSCFILSLL